MAYHAFHLLVVHRVCRCVHLSTLHIRNQRFNEAPALPFLTAIDTVPAVLCFFFPWFIIHIMTEIWKPWPKNPAYHVSTHGRVKSPRKILKLTAHISNNGYVRVYVGGGKKNQKQVYVHRMVAETFINNPENKPQVNHIDSNCSNNSVENLEWVTSSENALHGASKGHYRGAKSIFTEEDAKQWRQRIDDGESLRAIARSIGVMHTTIRYILKKYKMY